MTDSTALVRVTTPTSNRMWITNQGAPEEVLLAFGRELRRADALGRALDAAAWLADLDPDQHTERGGEFPLRNLYRSDICWLFDIEATTPTQTRLRIWGPNVAAINPDKRNLTNFDPYTAPADDPSWRFFSPDITSTGHLPALNTTLDLSTVEPLARILRTYLLDALNRTRQQDPGASGHRAQSLIAALVEFGDPHAPHTLPPGDQMATGSQVELMNAARKHYAALSRQDDPHNAASLLALIPDDAPLSAQMIADIEAITSRPLRGAALPSGGYGQPIPANARAALKRWAARWSVCQRRVKTEQMSTAEN